MHTEICVRHQRFGRWANVDCSKWFQQLGQFGFGAEPRHPFLKLLIDGIVREMVRPRVDRTFADVYIFTTSGPDFVTRLYKRHPEIHSRVTIIHNYLALPPDKDKFCFGILGRHHSSGSWRGDVAIHPPSSASISPSILHSAWTCYADPTVATRLEVTKIPRLLIQVQGDRQSTSHAVTERWSAHARELHPEWNYVLLRGAIDIDMFLSQNAPEILSVARMIPSELERQKIELVRWVAVFKLGGFSIDSDVELFRELTGLLNESAVFPHEEVSHCPPIAFIVLLRLIC